VPSAVGGRGPLGQLAHVSRCGSPQYGVRANHILVECDSLVVDDRWHVTDSTAGCPEQFRSHSMDAFNQNLPGARTLNLCPSFKVVADL